MKRSTAVLAMAITVLVWFQAMAAAAEEPAAPPTDTSAAVATPPPFDAEAATAAYLSQLSPEARGKSDAYYEGG